MQELVTTNNTYWSPLCPGGPSHSSSFEALAHHTSPLEYTLKNAYYVPLHMEEVRTEGNKIHIVLAAGARQEAIP